MTALIGIGGHLAAGKDVVADHLVDAHGFVKLGMSDPLLDAMLTINPVVPDWPTVGTSTRFSAIVSSVGYVEAKRNPEVRRLLQVLGTEVGRQMIGENVWVDMAGRKVDALRAEGKSVVITGIRFPNEVKMIHDRGGDSWWIERPSQTSGASHASENSVDSGDFRLLIFNDGTLDNLREVVEWHVANIEEVAA